MAVSGFSVLLLHSIYFKWENNGDVLSGTMAVFSLYLLVRCVCVAVLAAFRGLGRLAAFFGGRVLTLLLVSLLFCTPFYGGLQQLVLTGPDCGLDCVVGYCGFADGGALL